jgi:hypothetical protein
MAHRIHLTSTCLCPHWRSPRTRGPGWTRIWRSRIAGSRAGAPGCRSGGAPCGTSGQYASFWRISDSCRTFEHSYYGGEGLELFNFKSGWYRCAFWERIPRGCTLLDTLRSILLTVCSTLFSLTAGLRIQQTNCSLPYVYLVMGKVTVTPLQSYITSYFS